MKIESFGAAYSVPPFPLWERSDCQRVGAKRRPMINSAIRVRGFFLSIDRDPSPQPYPTRSRIYPTSTIEIPNSGKPELGGRGSSPMMLLHSYSCHQRHICIRD